MAASRKLSDRQVKRIRRRVANGERKSELAIEYGVNRKTIHRRLVDLERAEAEQALSKAERAHQAAVKRLQRQVDDERYKLLERELELKREQAAEAVSRLRVRSQIVEADLHAQRMSRPASPGLSGEREWLQTRKNLSGRALAEANGMIRLRNPEDTVCVWCERVDVDALINAGWLPA